MESLFILIPIAILIVALALAVFFWAVKSGQFEDLDTEGKRILFDADDKPENKLVEQESVTKSELEETNSAEQKHEP